MAFTFITIKDKANEGNSNRELNYFSKRNGNGVYCSLVTSNAPYFLMSRTGGMSRTGPDHLLALDHPLH